LRPQRQAAVHKAQQAARVMAARKG
jgi:hypothetical protein